VTARSAVVLALLLCGLFACSSDVAFQPLPAGATVLAFGDSVTHGTGAQPGEDYPSLLAQQTGWQVINAGIPGDTAREAKHRLAALLREHQPELVIVELGGNDFLRKRSPATVKQDLQTILKESVESGAITVLIAVPQLSILRAGMGALKDADIYQQLADDSGALLVDDIFSDVLSDETLRSDPVHPNALGYQQFTRDLIVQLRSAGLYQ